MKADGPKLGHLVPTGAQRDAVHVAVVPVIVGQDFINPGDHVALQLPRLKGEAFKVIADGIKVGVIDPFLKELPRKGDRVWLFLYPNTVTGLRHHYTHPLFGEDGEAEPATRHRSEADVWEAVRAQVDGVVKGGS